MFTRDRGRLSKRVEHDGNGGVTKHPGGKLARGQYERRSVRSMADLDDLIDGLGPGQAIAPHGVAEPEWAPVASRAEHGRAGRTRPAGEITRTREHFHHPSGAALFAVDIDDADGLDTAERVRDWFCRHVPELSGAPMLVKASAGAFIFDTASGDQLAGATGWRVYVLIANGHDAPRVGRVLVERLGDAVDASMYDGPERLDFAAGAQCGPGLEQRRGRGAIYNDDAAALDTEAAIEGGHDVERGSTGRAERQREIEAGDEILAALREHDLVLSNRRDGAFNIVCPRADEHTTPDNDTDCVYFPSHTGGFTVPAIVCKHGHCQHRAINDYRAALGLDAVDSRPTVAVAAGQLPRVVDDAIAALKAHGAPIYTRGGPLVRPVRVDAASEPDDTIRRPRGAVVVERANGAWLKLQLAEAAAWQRYDARQKKWLPCDPPRDVADTIAGVPDRGDWPELRAIVRAPVLWPDGTWSGTPGYTRGLLLDINTGWTEPGATRDDALAALATLRDHVRHFPWATDADEAAALSLHVTAVMRPTIDAAPMHAVDAPEAGTGKSLLIKSAAVLATGAPPAVMDYGRDPAEAAKRLDSMLLAADSMICVDNVEAALEGATLCQTLTEPYRRIRVLGASEVVTVPCTALITATGNNLTIRGDLVRRSITCRLDARVERPETRRIDQDVVADAHERRAELVAACQTIVAAYVAAGCPSVDVEPLGSFDQWSRLVRSALVWLGMPDPAASVERARRDDPARQEAHAVLAAWAAAFGDEPVTAAHAVERTHNDERLREALAGVALRQTGIDSRALGYWLRRHRGVRSGPYVLEQGPVVHGSRRWRVLGGDGGDGGDTQFLSAESVNPERGEY